MGKFINLPFLPLPEIGLSSEQAYDCLLEGKILKYKYFESEDDFIYVKQHPRRRCKFICSRDKSFKSFDVFCISRTKENFVDRYHSTNIFYLNIQ